RLLAETFDAPGQAAAHAQPGGEAAAALRPGEHPGDRPQRLHAAGLATLARPRADPQALDHIDRRGVAEVVDEALGPVHQAAVEATGGLRPRRRHLPPAGLARFRRPRPQAGTQHRAGGLFEVAQGDGADAVLAVDDLALFGQAQVTVHRAARSGDHRPLGLAATARKRAATAVEEGDADAGLLRQRGQTHLHLLQGPAR